MEKKHEKKNILIGALLVAIVFMSVGYAALGRQLNINGTTTISSRWDVKFISMTDGTAVGTATNKVASSFTDTTAEFSVDLVSPGDSMTYDIVVKNNGTLDAKLSSVVGLPDTTSTDPIKYTVTGVNTNDVLAAGESATVTIKVEYLSSIETQPTDAQLSKALAVTLNYVQSV